jgi:O-acetylserine/cysteine efflux transporter
VPSGTVGTTAEAPALSRVGLGQLAVSVVLLSSAFPVTKLALQDGAAPLWFALGRAGFSCLTGCAILAVLGRLRLPMRQDWPAILAVGLLQLAAFFALSHIALAYVPAGRSSILSNATTVWIAPLTVLVVREPISARRWAAAGVGLLGTIVLIGPWAIDWSAPGVLVGHIFLLLAALGFAIALIVVRIRPPYSPMLSLLPWCFGLATLPLALLAVAHGGGPGHWTGPAWEAMAYIGLVAGPFGTLCIMLAAAALPSIVASVGFLATPAIGLLLSTLLLGEPLGADLLAGSALILGSVGLAAWPQRRRGML